jgi:hypothetical protein
MKNFTKMFGIIAFVAVIGLFVITCDDGSNASSNQTPVAGDYTFGKMNQTAGSVTAVTITANPDKSPGAIENIKYDNSTTIPQTAGTYAVTFDVAAVTGWNAAVGLSAGNLEVSNQIPVTTPTADPESGTTIIIGDTITLTTATEGATIRYTTNGNTPTASSTAYSSPITITSAMISGGTVTIKAIAIKTGMLNSDILEAVYPVAPVATPTATPESGGTIAIGDTITLVTATEGATIRYTTNGNTPTISYMSYSSPITVTSAMTSGGTVTIKAIAIKTGMPNSAEMTATYTFSAPASYSVGSQVEWQGTLSNINAGGNDKEYTITITDNFSIAASSWNTFTPAGVTVNISGNYTISLSSNGSLLRIGAGQTVTLEDVGLAGSGSNNASLVRVDGYLTMSGEASIHGNTVRGANGTPTSYGAKGGSVSGGGVYIGNGGVFIIGDNASVHGNSAIGGNATTYYTSSGSIGGGSGGYGIGGGVYVDSNGTFIMSSESSVYNNGATGGISTYWLTPAGYQYLPDGSGQGGGVYVVSNGSFRIVSGTIYGNTEADTALRNIASTTSGGAAFFGTAQYGTFTGETWNSNGDLSSTNNTTKVVNGQLAP